MLKKKQKETICKCTCGKKKCQGINPVYYLRGEAGDNDIRKEELS